jgi:hypothetical protein
MLPLTNAVPPALIQEGMTLIADRIRGEFREMPGIALTLAQACRLWSLDMPTCIAALTLLIDGGFLCRKADGSYGRATDLAIHPRMAKAGIQPAKRDRPRRAVES